MTNAPTEIPENLKEAGGCVLILLNIGVGMFASSRMRRSFFTWFFLSFLVTPVVSFFFLMFLGPQTEKEAAPEKPPTAP